MVVTRRQFCTVGAGLVTSGVALGTASAQTSIEVSGVVRMDGDGEVGGTVLRFSNTTTDARTEATVEPDGSFSLIVQEAGDYRVTAFDESPDRDGVPVVYGFNNVSVSDDGSNTPDSSDSGDIGELNLPEAHDVSIRFFDADGDPIGGLPVNFRAANGTGPSPGLFTTDSEGYVRFAGASDRGVELAGRTEIEIQPDGESPTPIQSVFVESASEFEFTVQNPEQFGAGNVGDAGADDGSGEGTRERGLFSNSGDEPEFISNPFNLTMLGFLLSVAGIVHQMLQGR